MMLSIGLSRVTFMVEVYRIATIMIMECGLLSCGVLHLRMQMVTSYIGVVLTHFHLSFVLEVMKVRLVESLKSKTMSLD